MTTLDAMAAPLTRERASSLPLLVAYPRWQSACERASAALLGGDRLVLVTGPAGTGKSLLLDQVGKVMQAAGWSTQRRLADAAPPPSAPGTSLLVVDEADRLEPKALRELVDAAAGPLLLAGLDGLGTRLPQATTVTLPALGPEEARDYIAYWLVLTGRSPANLEAAGMRHLIGVSGGVPRLLSLVLAGAAWLAESGGDTAITRAHVEEAAALRLTLGADEAEKRPGAAAPRRPALVPTLSAMLLLGTAAFLVGRYFPSELRIAAGGAGQALAHWQDRLPSATDHTP